MRSLPNQIKPGLLSCGPIRARMARRKLGASCLARWAKSDVIFGYADMAGLTIVGLVAPFLACIAAIELARRYG